MNILIAGKLARSWLTGLVAVISFGLASTASAVTPFKDSIGPQDSQGDFVADCGDYAVKANYTLAGHFILFFDKEGFLKRAKAHLSYTNSVYYGVFYEDPNFVIGYAEPGVFLEGGPGEIQNETQTFTGGEETELTEIKFAGPAFKLTVPGYGVVLLEGGQIVFAVPSFEIIFRPGPHDILDNEVAALCAVIQPIPYENDT